ncbi:hypothetical protein COLO4_14114 [Corchorus olitorius]|uniref:F-box domain-containing protein n=1 Tax=Corchorus olitorius TaxID=93759 RepID=A0A1R3JTI4_9ROSI|nr:hypothetical protein COLO4_14114 [Corchorus olitorius]
METPQHVYDRFTDLPEDIILHIFFSFLHDDYDIVQLSSVCQKFRKICLSCPNLLFKLAFRNEEPCKANCKKIKRFLRDSVDIDDQDVLFRLCLPWFCHSHSCCYTSFEFLVWVKRALRNNEVQELDIAVPNHEPFKFPASYKSLTVLKLNKLRDRESKLVALDLPSLEALSLTSVSVDPGKFGEWVSSNSCKSLKVLNLEEFNSDNANLNISSSSLKVLTLASCAGPPEDGNLFISCSSLEKLSITNCSFLDLVLCVMNTHSLKALEISDCVIFDNFDININSVEQLQTFTLAMELALSLKEGSVPSINIPNSHSLRHAFISLEPFVSWADSLRNYPIFTCNGLIKLINGVRYAKSLQLNRDIIHALWYHDQWPKLEYLEHLEVIFDAEEDVDVHTYQIAAFVVGLCSLKTLTLRFDENATPLSETEVVNQLRSELLKKHGVESNHLNIICTAIENKDE